ncbi:MAG: YfcE family phosphodiesterase [Epsilonproteobacteria bacterium]|nr:YfcE family phosphodiesterase [Campylobacterota bacterium]
MKIGVLSDSHRKTQLHQEAIDHLISCGAEYLLHAGDLEYVEHLKILEASGLPYVCVYGNNDTSLIPLYGQYPIYKEPHYFKIQDLKIKMMHMPYYMSADADMVISGHTHYFEANMNGEILFLNPGEVCARNKNLTECSLVEVVDKKFKVTHHFKEPEAKTWNIRNIEWSN